MDKTATEKSSTQGPRQAFPRTKTRFSQQVNTLSTSQILCQTMLSILVGAGTRRKPRHADPGEVLTKGAAVGEIVRRLADGEAAPADETVYAPPRKKRPKAASAAAPPSAKATGAPLSQR